MGGKPRATCPPEQILEGYPRRVIALAERARRLVHHMIDGVTEAGYPGWRVIGLRRHGYFGFIAPMADHVRLGFEHGAALPDFAGILEGEGTDSRPLRSDRAGPLRGTQVRYVSIRTARQLESFGVKTLLSAALFDDETHGFRKRSPRR
jgi:hypothetical protein